MAQTVGIHVGERRFHLLALDGGLKKHKVLCAESGEMLPGEEGLEQVSERLKELASEHKLRADSVYLACDSGLAAFRYLTLPFDDRAKTEEVLKFEIESDLPQFDIEQVVVDFQVLSTKPGIESNLLVTAVPKEPLARLLRLCERAGLEPLDMELEGTALFDAALEAGVLKEESGTVLLHVGDTSTTVVVADGLRLATVRAIRAGALPARTPGAPEGSGEGDPEAELPPVEVGQPEVPPARLEEAAQRIRREVARTLSAVRSTNEIGQVFLCGHRLPGLQGETLLDLPVQELAIVPGETSGPEFAVAYGAALRGFEGGSLRPHLRREELRFSGKFERMELPLAVMTLLVFTLLFVQFIVLQKQIEWRDEGNLAKGLKGDMQIWLEASNQRVFPDPKNPYPVVRLPNPPQALANYASRAQAGEDDVRTKYGEILEIRRQIKNEITRLSKELGQISEVQQPQSALEATVLVLDQLSTLGGGVRFGIRSYQAQYQTSSREGDYVTVKMNIDFFGNDSLDATRQYDQLGLRFQEQPWCRLFEGKSSKPLDNEAGIQVDGLTIQVDVEKSHAGQS